MSSYCTQLRLVLWKNWLIKRRKPVGTLAEIIIPVVAMVFLVIARHFSGVSHHEPSFPSPTPVAYNITRVIWCNNYDCEKRDPMLGISRENLPVDQQKFIAQEVSQFMNVSVHWFDTEVKMVDYIEDPDYDTGTNNPIPVGVVFSSFGTSENGYKWEYTIRVKSTDTPPTDVTMETLVLNDDTTWKTYYYEGAGFIIFQDFFDKYIMTRSGIPLVEVAPTNIMLMPRPAYVKDSFQGTISNVLPFLLMFAYMYPFSRLVRELVEEKESRMKEAMKVMGLPDSVYWSSWGATYMIIFGLQSLLSTLMTTTNVFKYTNTGILLLYFFSFSLSMIGFAFLISAFFSKAKIAGSISMFLFYVSFIPYQTLKTPSAPHWAKQVASLLAPNAFSLGSDILGTYEGGQIGVQFTNWTQPVNGYTFRDCILWMLVDFVLYFVLAWYLDKVMPSEYGTRLSPTFFLSADYWGCCGNNDHRAPVMVVNDDDEEENLTQTRLERASSKVEMAPPELLDELDNNRGVKVRGLTKAFSGASGECLAVDHLDLDMFYGQCFALLGHNGAGKTTTINMLIGMLEPTGGDALINGYSIRTGMRDIRRNMGFCPQHSILFSSLTVKEHLEFFCYLKGVESSRIPEMVDEMIHKVGLVDKTHVRAGALSGGMQRKLSVSIALIGDSKIVFLDEPSSGMDPSSRRDTWNLIKEYQKDRVILLTTHFMDEADVLADRIAIMSHGRLRACGTSMYLKASYGVGYTFVISKSNDGCDEERLMELVHQHVPLAEVMSNVGTELTMRAPFSASKGFPALFDAMELARDDLGISNYGVSVTTLEEVFMKIASDEVTATTPEMNKAVEDATTDLVVPNVGITDERQPILPATPDSRSEYIRMKNKAKDGKFVDYNSINAPLLAQSDEEYNPQARDPDPSFGQHFKALFLKRMLYAKRDTKALVYQLLIPVIFLVLGLSVMQIPVPSLPRLVFSTDPYSHPLTVPIRAENRVADQFTSSVENAQRHVHLYKDETSLEYSHAIYSDRQLYVDSPRMGGFYLNATGGADHRMMYAVAFNITGTHSLPTFLNLGNEALLRARTPSARITTVNFPFPQNGKDKKATAAGDGIIVSMMTIIAFAFIPASYGMFVVRERENKSKHQQLVSGISIDAYWVSSYAWDVVNYLVPATAAGIIILAFNNPDFVGSNFGATVSLFLLYGTSVISFTYMLSFMFDRAGSAQNWLLVIYFITGLALSIASFVLSLLSSTKHVNKYLKFGYRLFPNFCLGDGLFSMSIRRFPVLFDDRSLGPFALDITGWNMIFMGAESVLYFAIVLLIEHGKQKRWFVGWFGDPVVQDLPEEEDSDIADERRRLQSGECDMDPIRIEGLRKVYSGSSGTGPVVAVRDLWLRVREGECFGYLGTNGAGKTTTMGMLTADVHPTRGTAHLDGMSILNEQREIRKRVGYCPQHDALFDLLTGREHLELFARIKGIHESELNTCVNQMLKQLTLQEYADRPAGKYSGGNKRKLSVAIALIGAPTLVFLDEPSSGVDPVSRRFMMSFIARTMKGRSVILTTHSMEECEALCQRIGIMVNGRLKCLGSPQHLKDKFAQGYQVDVRAESGHVDDVKAFMERSFAGVSVIEEHSVNIKFKLPPQQMTLGAIFGLLETNRDDARIQEYSVSQTTLEQVFLLLSKQQEMERIQQQEYFKRQYGPANDVVSEPVQPEVGDGVLNTE